MRFAAIAPAIVAPLVAACGLSVVGLAPTEDVPDASADAAHTADIDAAPSTDSTPIADADAALPVPEAGTTTITATSALIATNASIPLGTDGTVDWVFWGQATTERKNGANLITGSTAAGTVTYHSTPATVTWSDGAPDATGSVQSVAISQVPNVTLAFTVPAAATPRVFGLYLGGVSAPIEIDAALGGLLQTTTVTTGSEGTFAAHYVVTFSSTTTAATLTVSMKAGALPENGLWAIYGATLGTP